MFFKSKLKTVLIGLAPTLFLVFFLVEAAQGFDVDFSRRTKKSPDQMGSETAPSSQVIPASAGDPNIATHYEPAPGAENSKMREFVSHVSHERDWGNVDRQEVVILNTGKGFVPANVRLRKNMHYLIHVVNVNKDNKNVSFMLDAFNQHHSTFYGDTKTFKLDPEKEGVFEFQCPETSAAGKLVVFGPSSSPVAKDRSTASDD